MISYYLDQILIALIVGIFVYFISKYLDTKWARYSKNRRTKKIIKRRDELGYIDRLMNEKTRNDLINELNHNMLKAGLYLLIAFFERYILTTTNYDQTIFGELSKITGTLIYYIFFILVIINLLSIFSGLNVLRKTKKRLELPKQKLDAYDKKKFGITMQEVIELRAKNKVD